MRVLELPVAGPYPAYRALRHSLAQARQYEPQGAAQSALQVLLLSDSVLSLAVAQPVAQRVLVSVWTLVWPPVWVASSSPAYSYPSVQRQAKQARML